METGYIVTRDIQSNALFRSILSCIACHCTEYIHLCGISLDIGAYISKVMPVPKDWKILQRVRPKIRRYDITGMYYFLAIISILTFIHSYYTVYHTAVIHSIIAYSIPQYPLLTLRGLLTGPTSPQYPIYVLHRCLIPSSFILHPSSLYSILKTKLQT